THEYGLRVIVGGLRGAESQGLESYREMLRRTTSTTDLSTFGATLHANTINELQIRPAYTGDAGSVPRGRMLRLRRYRQQCSCQRREKPYTGSQCSITSCSEASPRHSFTSGRKAAWIQRGSGSVCRKTIASNLSPLRSSTSFEC